MEDMKEEGEANEECHLRGAFKAHQPKISGDAAT